MNWKKLRKDHDLTQEELAQKLDIKRSKLAMIETGKIKPSKELLAKVEKLYPNINTKDARNGNDINLSITEELVEEQFRLLGFVGEAILDLRNRVKDLENKVKSTNNIKPKK